MFWYKSLLKKISVLPFLISLYIVFQFNSTIHQLTINLDHNVDFLFPGRVLCHQRVLASIVAMDLIDDECS